ncbi:MAG TPA: LamG-like jellyroll fold domain-containing protein [Patescibacteria group bacterium]|nr:LamG-like jellyroll fold domain-containing protein [Patescibacteria group bacterium]
MKKKRLCFLILIILTSFIFAAAPNIPNLNFPKNGSIVYSYKINLNITATDPDGGNNLTVYIFGSNNTKNLNFADGLLYEGGNVESGSEITHNWTSTPVNRNETGLVLLMRFDNRSEYGENDTWIYDYSPYGNNGTIKGASFRYTNEKIRFFEEISDIQILNNTQHSGTTAPHTLTIIRPNPSGQWNGHTYWGYVGEQGSGETQIDLRFSEDLINWTAYESNPIVTRSGGARWPTVIFDNNTFWMTFQADYNSSWAPLYNSTDGINFFYDKILIPQIEGKRNPPGQILKDKNFFYLLYNNYENYTDFPNNRTIKIRQANTVEGLNDSSNDITLLSSNSSSYYVAAPNIFYSNGYYWLQTESQSASGIWFTEVYFSKNITGPYETVYNSPILAGGNACPISYLENGIIYDSICNYSGGKWRLDLVQYNASYLPRPDNNRLGGMFEFHYQNYITINDSDSLDMSNDMFSIEMWLYKRKVQQTGTGYIVSKSDDSVINHSYGIYWSESNNNLCYTIMNSGGCFNNSFINDDTWTHIAMTYNRSALQLKLYINGTLVATNAKSTDIIATTSKLFIGARGDVNATYNHPFSGFIDELAIFNRTLTADEVLNHYRLKNQTYYWKVNVSDGISTTSSPAYQFDILEDSIPPIISFSCSQTSVTSGQTITCSCSAIDKADPNPNVIYNIHPSTQSLGTYSTICSATDAAGNSAISSIDYTVLGISDFPTFKLTPEQLTSENGYEISLQKNWEVQFKFNNENHIVKLSDINDKTATIIISSEPITFNLDVNDTKKIDLNGDNYYDLSIFLRNISYGNANLILKTIHEEISAEEAGNNGTMEANQEKFIDIFGYKISVSKLLYFGASLIAIIIFLVVYSIIKKNRKR